MRASKNEGLHKWTFPFYIFIAVRKYHDQELRYLIFCLPKSE